MGEPSEVAAFLIGKIVRHATFGEGLISGLDDDLIVVLFDQGEKRFKRDSFLDFHTLQSSDRVEVQRIAIAIKERLLFPEDALRAAEAFIPLMQNSPFCQYHQETPIEFSFRLIQDSSMLAGLAPIVHHGQMRFPGAKGVAEATFILSYAVDESVELYPLVEERDVIVQREIIESTISMGPHLFPDAFGGLFAVGTGLVEQAEDPRDARVLALYRETVEKRGREPDDTFGILVTAQLRGPDDLRRFEAYLYYLVRGASAFFGPYCQSSAEDIADIPESEAITVLDYSDILVISERRTCSLKGHPLTPVSARFTVIAQDSRRSEVDAPAFHCSRCSVYFMLPGDFERLARKGRVACQVVTKTVYRKIAEGDSSSLAAESVLRRCGYTVSKKDGLSEKTRRGILEEIIEQGVLTLSTVRNRLEWFISMRAGKPEMEDAIEKWESDLDYLARKYRDGAPAVKPKIVYRKQYLEKTDQ